MQITYNKAAILDSTHQVLTHALSMEGDRDHVRDLTQALLDQFSGINAGIFGDHQHQFIQAYSDLIMTVQNFGKTVEVVVGDASDIDAMLAKQV